VLLAETWNRLSPDELSYATVGETLLGVELEATGGRYRRAIHDSFVWREIGQVEIGPRLTPLDETSHSCSARTLLPSHGHGLPPLSYHEQVKLARISI
jgi:hypothetical protein